MVYLIHFEAPIGNLENSHGQAQHYIGQCWDTNLEHRLEEHRTGQGSKLLHAVSKKEIPWSVVRTWPKRDRLFERWLKNQKNAWRLCPVCNPHSYHRRGNH